jgi:serine/threonine-protein kinase
MPELCAAVLTEAPASLDVVRPGVPIELARAIHHCLEKSPALRTQSVAELARAIEPFGSEASEGMALRIEANLTTAPVITDVNKKPEPAGDDPERTVAGWESDSAARRRTRGIAIGIGGGMAALALVVLVLVARWMAAPDRVTTAKPAPVIVQPVPVPAPVALPSVVEPATTIDAGSSVAPAIVAPTRSATAPARSATAPHRVPKPDAMQILPTTSSSAPAHAF